MVYVLLQAIGLTEIILLLVIFGFGALFVWLMVKLFASRFGNSKRCPHCAEMIKAEANLCRFCGREI